MAQLTFNGKPIVDRNCWQRLPCLSSCRGAHRKPCRRTMLLGRGPEVQQKIAAMVESENSSTADRVRLTFNCGCVCVCAIIPSRRSIDRSQNNNIWQEKLAYCLAILYWLDGWCARRSQSIVWRSTAIDIYVDRKRSRMRSLFVWFRSQYILLSFGWEPRIQVPRNWATSVTMITTLWNGSELSTFKWVRVFLERTGINGSAEN